MFLVGCYNSGTTLLHQILASHPSVGSMPDEGQFFTDQLPVPRELGLARLWALRPELFRLVEGQGAEIDVDRLKRQWGAKFNDPTRPLLIEKSPTNAARTRWLQDTFRPASFIGLIRDGRAVAEGIRRKRHHDIRLAARQWAESNRIMLEDFEHLERARLVRYEDLTAAPDRVTAELLEFLGLTAPAASLDGTAWRVHEQESTIRNMNVRSLEALSDDDLQAIREEAGEMLKQLGYT